MKLWTPVGLCSDANEEPLLFRGCTFGFTTPFFIPPPGESLNCRGGLNHSLGKSLIWPVLLAFFLAVCGYRKEARRKEHLPITLGESGLEVLNWGVCVHVHKLCREVGFG